MGRTDNGKSFAHIALNQNGVGHCESSAGPTTPEKDNDVNTQVMKTPRWVVFYHYHEDIIMNWLDEDGMVIERGTLDPEFQSKKAGYDNPIPKSKTEMYLCKFIQHTSSETGALDVIGARPFASPKALRDAVKQYDRYVVWPQLIKDILAVRAKAAKARMQQPATLH